VTPDVDRVFASWEFSPSLAASLLVSAVLYLRGWRIYHQRDPDHWPLALPASFLGGLFAIFLALASPIETFSSLSSSIHMMQHLLLMMVAPPLLWLGAPLLPVVRGLPEPVRLYWAAPLLQSRWLQRVFSFLVRPAVALVLFTSVTWFWHAPIFYDAAVESPFWHYVQHICFLGGGLLFWFPIVRPYPFRPTWPVWVLLPYLIAADLSNTAFSALLTFSERVLYSRYAAVPPIWGVSAIEDQAGAGALMWVFGSLAYLLPMAGISLYLMFGESLSAMYGTRKSMPAPISRPGPSVRKVNAGPAGGRVPLPLLDSRSSAQFDLLEQPVLGRALLWRRSRLVLQVLAFALAAVVVIDGLTGPDVAAMNLAGVTVWNHWRGLLVLGLLVGGNVFCAACPFTLPRTLARRVLPAGMPWPRRLRGKWLAIALLAAFFSAYEAFALWDSPLLTAYIALGYFLAAFLVDGLFSGASFCKYVCPVGQFNFVQSLVSPLEVAVRDPAVCSRCRTRDCIRGRGDAPGCELELYQPAKRSNMDCTFCLDCVRACPHGNVGVVARAPTLLGAGGRSALGRFASRSDVAALIILLVFAAFVNAAGMVEPVLGWETALQKRLGLTSPRLLIFVLTACSLVFVPAFFISAASWSSRRLGRLGLTPLETCVRFALSLVPLGFAMWLAHYGYHLATTYDSAWPVIQRFAADHGWAALGDPSWRCACCVRVGGWVTKAELFVLDVGMLASLYAAERTARNVARSSGRAFGALLPWAVLILAMFAAGVWIVLQPMQMRGAM
jgi:cytochrome c oxidase assembly factor CtaG/ferredoxin